MSGSPLMQRFQAADIPRFHPGQCAACGSPNGPVLDTNIDVPQAGGVYRIYLCFDDLRNMVAVVDQYTGAGETTEEATRSNPDEVVISRELFDNIVAAGTLLSASVDGIVDSDLEFAEPAEADGEGDEPGFSNLDSNESDVGERDESEFTLSL